MAMVAEGLGVGGGQFGADEIRRVRTVCLCASFESNWSYIRGLLPALNNAWSREKDRQMEMDKGAER